MKKMMIVSAFALTICATAAYAQDANVPAAPAQPATPVAIATQPGAAAAIQDEQKTKLDIGTLPESVKKTLASDTYKDWQVATAWEIKGTTTYYVLEMKKGDENMILKLNKEGKQIG